MPRLEDQRLCRLRAVVWTRAGAAAGWVCGLGRVLLRCVRASLRGPHYDPLASLTQFGGPGRVARGGHPPPALTEPDLWISHPALRDAGVRAPARIPAPELPLLLSKGQRELPPGYDDGFGAFFLPLLFQ